VGGNRTEKVDGNAEVAVKGNLESVVDGNATHEVKGNLGVSIDGDVTVNAKGNFMGSVDGDSTLSANEIKMSARSKITLACGSSTIELSPGEISIKAPFVKINS
jgi:type VI secretion system secreted protein VgrG